ncbi:hypothetical protein BUALT_Bualt02G0217900 [Buddleja alternifolia]|uniref:Uncharacterized protein n=1 Tax=Buddleja alternifolia TaxID=168488 RepID=A0AAV6Y3N3_9LAMI|nr:hypothetical protein BUALT_Bualt02G0217900 [Buddleja alternifolia]
METVVVAHHRNHHQYYGRNRGDSSTKFESLVSPPSGNFRGINCRTFHYGGGLLPTPLKSRSKTTPVTRKDYSVSLSPKTPSPYVNQNQKSSKRIAKCSSMPIPIKIKFNKEAEFHFSELWAGPAYSNSPPPSSLPIPKFSLPPKRTVSLELPTFASEIDLHPISKSAPASPTRERSPSPSDLFDSRDSATKTLRRILNLDWCKSCDSWLVGGLSPKSVELNEMAGSVIWLLRHGFCCKSYEGKAGIDQGHDVLLTSTSLLRKDVVLPSPYFLFFEKKNGKGTRGYIDDLSAHMDCIHFFLIPKFHLTFKSVDRAKLYTGELWKKILQEAVSATSHITDLRGDFGKFLSNPKGLTKVDEFLVSRIEVGLIVKVLFSESEMFLVKKPLKNLGEPKKDEIGVVVVGEESIEVLL